MTPRPLPNLTSREQFKLKKYIELKIPQTIANLSMTLIAALEQNIRLTREVNNLRQQVGEEPIPTNNEWEDL